MVDVTYVNHFFKTNCACNSFQHINELRYFEEDICAIMMPEISGDLNDSGAEEIVNLAQFDGKIMHLPLFIYSTFQLKILLYLICTF